MPGITIQRGKTMENEKKRWTVPPRKMQNVKKAIDAVQQILWIGKSRVTLSGIIGKSEDRSLSTVLFGGSVVKEYTEFYHEVGEKFDWSIDAHNAAAILAMIKTRLPELAKLLPIDDQRQTQEQADKDRREMILFDAQQNKERAERQAVEQIEVDRLKVEFPYLETKDDSGKSTHALVGHNIRLILGRHFPGQVFSVTTESYSMGSSCNVNWTDGPTEKEVRDLVWRFEAGVVNAMTDGYDYRQDAFHVFGSIKHLFFNRKFSQSRIAEIAAEAGLPAEDSGLLRNAAADKSFYSPLPDLPPSDKPVAGIRIQYNSQLGGIEIYFPHKPVLEVLAELKTHGWQWARRKRCWYAKNNPVNEAFARRIAG